MDWKYECLIFYKEERVPLAFVKEQLTFHLVYDGFLCIINLSSMSTQTNLWSYVNKKIKNKKSLDRSINYYTAMQLCKQHLVHYSYH